MTNRTRLRLGTALLALVLPNVAFAQVSNTAEPAPQVSDAAEPVAQTTDESAVGVEEIIVTAERRSENIQRVPVAISALSAQQLERQGIVNVTGIATQVPNFQISTPYSDAIPVFSLRGISAVDYSQNQSSPVALYVDEVYKGLPVFTSQQIYDLDRIEVLRGPQGTLYGKNTTGGAVNLYSRKPDLDAGFTGYLTAGYGRFDRFELNGATNVPIIDNKAAARVAFTRTKVDGFVKNLVPGQPDQGSIDDWAVRASLALRPTDSIDLNLRYSRSKSTPTGYGVLATDIGAYGPGGAGFGTEYTRAGLGFFENENDRSGRLRIKNESVALTINWDLNDVATLTSVSSYDDGSWLTEEDADATPFNLLHDDYFSDGRAYAQDVRLASSGNTAFKWLVGAYFYKDRVLSTQLYRYYYDFAGDNDGNGQLDCFDDGFTGCGYSNEFKQVRKSFALYTQNSYRFENGLTITAGLRYTKDNNELKYYRAFLRYLDPATGQEALNAVQTITAPPIDQLKSDNISGKLGLSYELENGTLLYANISRGYRGGSFNGQALFDPSEVTVARPERLDAIEVGAKMQTADRRVRLNTAAFYYDYRNQQFLDVTPDFLQVLYNAPKSRLWGLEAELTAVPVEPLTVRFGASYLNSKYREIVLQGQDLSGNQLILAPKWSLSGGIDWKVFEGSFGNVQLHTDSRYSSRLFFDAFNTALISQPGYTVHDARLTFETASEAFEISAWIRNITNKKYRVYGLELGDSFNLNYAQRGRPREYGIQGTFRF